MQPGCISLVFGDRPFLTGVSFLRRIRVNYSFLVLPVDVEDSGFQTPSSNLLAVNSSRSRRNSKGWKEFRLRIANECISNISVQKFSKTKNS